MLHKKKKVSQSREDRKLKSFEEQVLSDIADLAQTVKDSKPKEIDLGFFKKAIYGDTSTIAASSDDKMLEAAKELDFERAAFLRDQLKELKEMPDFSN